MIVRTIEFIRRHFKTTLYTCYLTLALLVTIDTLFISKENAHTFIERIPGFWAFFGFIACALIIIISKWFGHTGIMQREDYYD